MYFVRESDAGPGSWTKPADLLDIPEYLSGSDSTSGSTSHFSCHPTICAEAGPLSSNGCHLSEVRF
jgi:hypothetical protein